jgi:MFS family permease
VERRRWWILGVLAFSVLVIVLDNSVLNVALPSIVRELHASSSELQWMVDAYSLAFAGLLLTMGSLGDKYGRRPALQIGFLVFGAGSALSATAGSSEQLIATRALMGVGAALIMPATLSIITKCSADERPKAIAIWTATAGVAVALAPSSAGSARALLLGIDLPGEPAHRRSRSLASAFLIPTRATRRHRDSTGSVRSSPSSGCARCCTR